MFNQFFVATKAIYEGLEASLRVGKVIGRNITSRKALKNVDPWEMEVLARHSPRGISGMGAAQTAGAVVGATEAYATDAAKRVGFWSQTVGKARASQAWKFLSTNTKQRNLALAGAAGAYGYMTASPEATTGQKLGRAVGFAGLTSYGIKIGSNKAAWASAKESFKQGEFTQAFKSGFGIDKWTLGKSILAGGTYGLISDQSSMMEGAATGFVADIGLRGLSRTWGKGGRGPGSWNPRQNVFRAYKREGIRAAFNAAPVFRTGIFTGAIIGAYKNVREGNPSGMNVLGGAIGGALLGGALGGGAKFGVRHPWMTLGITGPTLTFGSEAAMATATVAQAGAPGFDTLNADGDLALALHKIRHG